MKIKLNLLTIAVAIGTGLIYLLGSVAQAHHVWLNATKYSLESPEPSAPAKTTIYFGWGDLFPVHDFIKPEQISSFALRSPQGQMQMLRPSSGGFSATPIELATPGTYLVTTELAPRISTRIVENGQPKSISIGRNEIRPGIKILESKQVRQSAKAILNVGGSKDRSATTVLGKSLELVPTIDPTQLREGDYLTLKVYINGKPLSRPYFYGAPELAATYLGFSSDGSNALTLDAEGNGTVRMRINRYGIWQVYGSFTEPAPPELAAKVDRLEYKTSLTFEIK